MELRVKNMTACFKHRMGGVRYVEGKKRDYFRVHHAIFPLTIVIRLTSCVGFSALLAIRVWGTSPTTFTY